MTAEEPKRERSSEQPVNEQPVDEQPANPQPANPQPEQGQAEAARSKRSRGKRIALWVGSILVGLVLVVVVGFNIYTRATYSEFYSTAAEEFEIPGIHAGFICQDLDYYDEGECWFFSGYSTGDGPSPLYRRVSDGASVEFFAELPDGSPYVGHGSAITTSSEFAFLACDDGYLVFNVDDLASAESGSAVRAIDRVNIGLSPAFMNIENDTLFAGTFHLMPNYAAPEHHHYSTPAGDEHASIMFAYPADMTSSARYGFASEPSRVYSLPDKVQGMCQLPNGDFVLSISYGFTPSTLRVYRDGGAEFTFVVEDKAIPLSFLDSSCLITELSAPPMTEGIEYHAGRVYISEESASNKYFFGKLYGAGDVFSVSEKTLGV